MDMLGHVNNTVFFRYIEQARIEWTYGLHDAATRTRRQVSDHQCEYLPLPLVYPGEIEVRMYLADPGRTSVGSYYEILKDGTKHADGAAKLVWIDLATGRSVPLPDRVTAPLRALESAGGRAAHGG